MGGKVTPEQLLGKYTTAMLDEIDRARAEEDLAEKEKQGDPSYLKGVLEACLGGHFSGEGFKLIECNDHTLRLEHDGETVACFNATTVTVYALRQECHRHLCDHH